MRILLNKDVQKKDRTVPTPNDLLRLWLRKHFKGVPVVVLSNPLGWVEYLRELFPQLELLCAQYAILPCKSLEEALTVCRATPDNAPYACVWLNGKEIEENT